MNWKNITDHLGIVAACACVFHCVALPLLLISNVFVQNEAFHVWTLGLTILVTGHALWHGYNNHCRHIVLFFGGLGMACLMGGITIDLLLHDHGLNFSAVSDHHGHSLFEEYGEQIITIIGSMLIITAHIYNMKFKKNCCNH